MQRLPLMLKGENMIHSCRIAIVGVVVLLLGLPLAWAESDPNTKIADRFDVSFGSARYATLDLSRLFFPRPT